MVVGFPIGGAHSIHSGGWSAGFLLGRVAQDEIPLGEQAVPDPGRNRSLYAVFTS